MCGGTHCPRDPCFIGLSVSCILCVLCVGAVGLCEDWDSEENEEAFATACAASGTLASAVGDAGVAKALLSEKCGISLLSLLESQQLDLVHRCLVIVLELLEDEEHGAALATHLLESGIVPHLAQVCTVLEVKDFV